MKKGRASGLLSYLIGRLSRRCADGVLTLACGKTTYLFSPHIPCESSLVEDDASAAQCDAAEPWGRGPTASMLQRAFEEGRLTSRARADHSMPCCSTSTFRRRPAPTSGLASGLTALRHARARGSIARPVLVPDGTRIARRSAFAGLDAALPTTTGPALRSWPRSKARLGRLVRRAHGTEDIATLGQAAAGSQGPALRGRRRAARSSGTRVRGALELMSPPGT